MVSVALPDSGEVGFYVHRVWPWGLAVGRAAVGIGVLLVVAAAVLVRDELARANLAAALALVGVGTAVAGGIVIGKPAKEFAEQIAKGAAAVVTLGFVLYAAGVGNDGPETDSQFIAAVLVAVAVQLVIYGAASLRFRSTVDEGGDIGLRTWLEAAQHHSDRPLLKSSRIGVWELVTAPLLLATFKGISIVDRPWLWTIALVALYALLLVVMSIYLAVPRWILTRVVLTPEAERYLTDHGAVPARAVPFRRAWKRPGTWRAASLPRSGPYRFTAFRRVCEKLEVPVPESELQLVDPQTSLFDG
jgi:hypothetical protein